MMLLGTWWYMPVIIVFLRQRKRIVSSNLTWAAYQAIVFEKQNINQNFRKHYLHWIPEIYFDVLYYFIRVISLDVVAHACNPSTCEAEAGRLPWIPGQPGLHSEFKIRPGHDPLSYSVAAPTWCQYWPFIPSHSHTQPHIGLIPASTPCLYFSVHLFPLLYLGIYEKVFSIVKLNHC